MRTQGNDIGNGQGALRLTVVIAAGLLLLVGVMASAAADSDPSLYAAYHLDEGEGTVLVDSSGNARPGTITNGVWTDDAVQGMALDFSIERTEPIWASLPGLFPFHDPAAGGSPEATLSFWVKPVDNNHRTLFWTRDGVNTPDANRFHIFSGADQGSPPPGYGILGVDYRSPNDEAFVRVFEEPIPLGAWTKVVMTRTLDAGTYTYMLYFDGVLAATYDHPTGDLPDSSTWSIGRMDEHFLDEGFWFNGQLDEIQVWTRALSVDEIAEGPVQWPTDEGGNDHWYRLSPRPVEGLDDAIRLAAETTWLGQPGYVVSVLSEGEKDFLVDKFGSETLYLIGYTDRDEEGIWRWVSGEPSGYEFWASGEPNNFNNEDYAAMNWQHEEQPEEPEPPGAWNDLPGWGGYAIFEYEGLVVSIDIKPGSDPNSINCKNEKSNIAVAVLTTDDFDAASVDHSTVNFEGATETHVAKKTGEPRRHQDDVDGDGDVDLVFHFRLGDTSLTCGSTMGTLIGETYDGVPIQGSDSVRMVGGGAACGSTPDSAGVSCQDIRDRCPGTPSGERWIAPDGTTPILAYCEMDDEGNGWTLIYNRNNAYFSPDHMYQKLPAQGPDFSANSTSWFIPNDATRWRWEVSVDSGATYRTLETSIPPEARATAHATVENAPIGTVYENTTGASGPFQFQTIVFSDRCRYSCDSGSASWWGIVNVSQGAGDQDNPGLGGHTDSCSLDSMLLPGDNYTWGDGNLELYLSDWKDIGGDGIGGTNCVPDSPTTQYRYRFWAR